METSLVNLVLKLNLVLKELSAYQPAKEYPVFVGAAGS